VEQDFPLGRSEQGLSGRGSREEKFPFFVLHANRLTLARPRLERGEVSKEIASVCFHAINMSDIIRIVKRCGRERASGNAHNGAEGTRT